MKSKYIAPIKNIKVKGDGLRGRYTDPSTWKTGPNPLTREKYYAFLKHRSQASYRKETYNLSWEDWQSFWNDDDFVKRGRKVDDLCLTRYNFNLAWDIDNCVVCTRREHFDIKKEANKIDKS